jgi:hypothetical protein
MEKLIENPVFIIGVGLLFIMLLALMFGYDFRATLTKYFDFSAKQKDRLKNKKIKASKLDIKAREGLDIENEEIDGSDIKIQ